ncbi:MAG: DUF5667 domain-containing protein [Mycobacteriales bacterium]
MLPRRPPLRARPDPGARRLENALRGLAVAGPAPDFEVRLRARLVAVSAVQARAVTAPRTRSLVHRPPRWLPRAVAAGAAGVVGIAGVGVATSRALPGQPLYGAKRQIESWQLSLASGPADRGREQLSFARTRLSEVEALSQHHDLTAAVGTSAGGAAADRIAVTLRRMDAETRAGTSDLAVAARAGDGQAARQLLTFAADQSSGLVELAPQLPAPAASAADASRSVLRQVAALARTLPGAPAASTANPAAEPTSSPVSPSRPTTSPSTAGQVGPAVVGDPSADPTTSAAAPATQPRRQPSRSEPAYPHGSPSDPSGWPSDPPPPWAPPTSILGLLGGQQSSDS